MSSPQPKVSDFGLIIIQVAAVKYFYLHLGDLWMLEQESYIVNTRLTSSTLRTDAYVETAESRIGSASSIVFDSEDCLTTDKGVPAHENAAASIRTTGIIED